MVVPPLVDFFPGLRGQPHDTKSQRDWRYNCSALAEFQQVPSELSFFQGDVDLGFESLGLPPQQQHALRISFDGDGIAIPGTAYRLRRLPNSTVGAVEPATGQEPLLPIDRKQAICTLAGNDFSYVGKKVRRNDQLPPNFEPATDANYKDVGDGHVKI